MSKKIYNECKNLKIVDVQIFHNKAKRTLSQEEKTRGKMLVIYRHGVIVKFELLDENARVIPYNDNVQEYALWESEEKLDFFVFLEEFNKREKQLKTAFADLELQFTE